MKRINTFTFVELGERLEFLKSIKEGMSYADVFIGLWLTRNTLNNLLKHDSLNLRTSKASVKALIDSISAIVPWDPSVASENQEKIIDSYQIWAMSSALNEFRTVLSAELNVIDTYAVSQKGAYSTSDLVENADIVFPSGIRQKVPDQAIQDIRQAGKCLAFDTPTAAGFHITRAIEATIVHYYKAALGTETQLKMRNWGVYIKNLEASGKADIKIIELLKHIKDSYRNPVTHPEAELSTDEISVLFGLAISAITQMVIALP